MSLIARFRGTYPPALWTLLDETHLAGGLSIQGDPARQRADMVALAASLGWLSTITPDGHRYTRVWRLTAAGLQALTQQEFFTS